MPLDPAKIEALVREGEEPENISLVVEWEGVGNLPAAFLAAVDDIEKIDRVLLRMQGGAGGNHVVYLAIELLREAKNNRLQEASEILLAHFGVTPPGEEEPDASPA